MAFVSDTELVPVNVEGSAVTKDAEPVTILSVPIDDLPARATMDVDVVVNGEYAVPTGPKRCRFHKLGSFVVVNNSIEQVNHTWLLYEETPDFRLGIIMAINAETRKVDIQVKGLDGAVIQWAALLKYTLVICPLRS